MSNPATPPVVLCAACRSKVTPADRAIAVGKRVHLTPAEQRLVELLIEYESIHGQPPTLDYLAERERVTKVTIYERVGNLEAKGVVTRENRKARSVRVREVA